MFSALSSSITSTLNSIRSRGHLSEQDIDTAMRQIRIALLEADVSLGVVKAFIHDVREKALQQEVIKNVMPGQMVVKIVHDELVAVLGGVPKQKHDIVLGAENSKYGGGGDDDGDRKVEFRLNGRPHVIMMIGLQGVGKTTTSAKLALYLKRHYKKNILLASCDTYRPGAQLQLEILAKEIAVDSLSIVEGEKPGTIVERALGKAEGGGYDVLILDTAGRLQTDDAMIRELVAAKELVRPHDILMVGDSMIGQEAAKVAKEFQEKIGDLTGIILTKVDGDAKGGAALSMKMVTGCPIRFVTCGEKMSDLEIFHPDRVASRILGMGDVVSLVEQASDVVSEQEANNMMQKLQKNSFGLDDLLKQMKMMKKMGGLSSILGMIPGMGRGVNAAALKGVVNDGVFAKYEVVISSMTKAERADPGRVMNASRKRRVAKGAGCEVQDVNRLLKHFNNMKTSMKRLTRSGNLAHMMKGKAGFNPGDITKLLK